MVLATLVNGQITDSVAQSNVSVLGAAPAIAMGSIYQSAAHATGLLFHNSVQAQQNTSIAAQAATNLGVMQIYSANTTAAAVAAARLARSEATNSMLTMLIVLAALKQI